MGNTTPEKLWDALNKLAEARDELRALTGIPAVVALGNRLDPIVLEGVAIYDGLGGGT